MKTMNLVIIDETELYARPTSNICKEAGKYASKIELWSAPKNVSNFT